MASGRMLKAQISISEQVNDLSIYSALLFTWMIPHADDFGRMMASPRKIKAQVVPMREDFTIAKVEECLAEISEKNLIELYYVDGCVYIQFPSFDEHQTGLHKRTKSKFPGPELGQQYDSGKFREIPGNSRLTEQNRTEQNRTESYVKSLEAETASGEEVAETDSDNVVDISTKRTQPPPYQSIVDAYHELLPTLAQVYKLTDTRKTRIKNLWRDELDDVESWRNYFKFIGKSDFLMGRTKPKDGRVFIADFDFITNPTNFVKIAEEKYHGKKVS